MQICTEKLLIWSTRVNVNHEMNFSLRETDPPVLINVKANGIAVVDKSPVSACIAITQVKAERLRVLCSFVSKGHSTA